eukprot:Nitzschia sp. Nitz4//scaffold96_size78090//47993//49826//NITZ4_005498-RA/size78090-processed-gene-0.31-mRNA-1//1//CDS//3329560585//3754//frame0
MVQAPSSKIHHHEEPAGLLPDRAVHIPSQARRRLEAYSSGLDYRLAGSFLSIFLLYTVITFGTWMHVESQQMSDPITIAVSSPHLVASTQLGKVASDVDAKPLKLQDIHDITTLQHTFPMHVGDDMEEIDHPGILLADKVKFARIAAEHPELPKDGKMRVPKFWRPVAYGEAGVRGFLGNHGERLITPEEAAQIGSWDPVTGLETIYVSVASYRDPECQLTVEDMFLRAEHPERLRVAIIDQRADNDPVPPCNEPVKPCSEDPDQALCKYSHLIDPYPVPAQLSIGPVFARHLANRMYRGEYFAMQVDSHVRFIRDWDSDIVSQWRSANNEMGVLSVYLSDIIDSIDPVTFENRHPNRPIMCKTDYESQGKMRHLRHGQQPEGRPGIHGEPTLHPFWAAGFSFARGHFVVQVPYDQYQPMVFQGEEIFQGLRGFTYGYDYYAPETSVAFHMYAIKENKDKRKKIKLFWENSNFYPGSAVEGMKRLNAIIGMGDPEDANNYYSAEAEEYGLGLARPKETFFKLYGIHTETKTVEDHLCTFVGKPMMQQFKPHLRKNGMGINFAEFDFAWKDPYPPEKAKQ